MVSIKIEQNLALFLFVILEILNAMDRPIVDWYSIASLKNKTIVQVYLAAITLIRPDEPL